MRSCQRRKVKDFFIKFKKKSHFADFFTEHTLDFVLHRLLGGLAEMDTDDIGGLANLLSDSRASGGVGCGIVHGLGRYAYSLQSIMGTVFMAFLLSPVTPH